MLEIEDRKVYVVLLNYNGWRDTLECLESVFRSDWRNFKVVVVDNMSQDESMEHIKKWANGEEHAENVNGRLSSLSVPYIEKPIQYLYLEKEQTVKGVGTRNTLGKEEKDRLVLIQAGENRGFAAGNNIGIKYVLKNKDASWIWLLNNDTVVEPNALRELLTKAEQYKKNGKKIGIIGTKLKYYSQPELIQGVGGQYNKWFAVSSHIGELEEDKGQYDNELVLNDTSYPIGASMFVDKDYVLDIGLMCEDYFLYYEELDWTIRGRQRGWDIGYCWTANIFHKEGSSIGTNHNGNERSWLADYYGLRNRITFTRKYYRQYTVTVLMGFLYVIFNRIRRGQYDRVPKIIKLLIDQLITQR